MRMRFIVLLMLVDYATYSQDSNILLSLSSPAHGVKIKNNFPTGAGGFARAFMLSNQDASENFVGLGVYGTYSGGVSTMGYAFIGPSHSGAFMVFKPNGSIGIGTATPTEKLSINGKIRAHEIKVEMANWPDFVFDKSYKLPTLQETENHIKEKGHLPDIPSATEVGKNGVELGDMNKKLLQKIEELTLYLIKINKTVEDQSKELAEQKAQIIQLKSDIK